jgi:hypothetical protein
MNKCSVFLVLLLVYLTTCTSLILNPLALMAGNSDALFGHAGKEKQATLDCVDELIRAKKEVTTPAVQQCVLRRANDPSGGFLKQTDSMFHSYVGCKGSPQDVESSNAKMWRPSPFDFP